MSNPFLVRVLSLALLSCPALADEFEVVLVGDESRTSVVKQCAAPCDLRGATVATPPRNSTAAAVASMVYKARHVLLVVDATVGPTPMVREHVIAARQAEAPTLSVLFVNVAGLDGMPDAGELLELEELEVRELMNIYKMAGDSAVVFHDAPIKARAKKPDAIGLSAAVARVQRLSPRERIPVRPISLRAARTEIYLLTKLESAEVVPIRPGDNLQLWLGGQEIAGRATGGQTILPGDVGPLGITFAVAIQGGSASRFLIQRNGRLVAVGVVSATTP